MIKTINQALDYIYSFINLENKEENKYSIQEYSLENIKKILNILNNPQNNKKIIHVAGTKGKGSVSMMISGLLTSLHYNVTTFLSPHLVKPNERILYNLNPITDKELINIIIKIQQIILKNNLKPTTFEFFFIIFLLFSEIKNSDYLVIEVGLGGRLDCTNIINPLISVITSISLDHTKILGKTISKIAYEKAGIIKPTKPVVVSEQNSTVYRIINKKAKQNNSKLYLVKNNFKLLKFIKYKNGFLIDFNFFSFMFKNIFISLIGKHQAFNFFSALQVVYLIDSKIIDTLLYKKEFLIKINGRIQIINEKYPIILDVAHNKDSAKKLKETLNFYYPKFKWSILSGMTGEKDYKSFYKELKPVAKNMIITTPSHYKKSDPENVYKIAKSIIKNTQFIPDFKDAAFKILNIEGPILITGSFYISGPFLEFWENFNNSK